jgi:predicted Rossmann fold flavoprotein
MSERYPRGERALISPLHRFSASDTMTWFERRGVRLKTEEDGRMFPVTDSSGTVIDCLLYEARAAGVRLFTRKGVDAVRRTKGGFELQLADGKTTDCDRVLLATGGTRSIIGGQIAASLGHDLAPPVPSLFSFHVAESWLRSLPGVSVSEVEASVPSARLRERGPVLITHQGLSGPVILRLSAWGARALHELDYQFPLRVNWLPGATIESVQRQLQELRGTNPNKLITNSPLGTLPYRLWEKLTQLANVDPAVRATTLSREQASALAALLVRTELTVHGKSLNKDEFVTCGGVKLSDVNFKTMESRVVPGLYFAGEL